MYKCKICGTVFRNPSDDQLPVYHVNPGGSECVGEPICPECGAYEFTEVTECPRCHGLMEADTTDIICPECRKALREVVENFIDGLSDPQLDQVDVWMDGCSIHDRERWT